MTKIVLLAQESALLSALPKVNCTDSEKNVIEVEFRENLILGRYRPAYIRNVLDQTVEGIAQKLDISRHTWRSYETNRRRIPIDIAKKLEELFQQELAMMINCLPSDTL